MKLDYINYYRYIIYEYLNLLLIIQRILKYPLLIREIITLSRSISSSKLRRRLSSALSAMNGVARHINDMQTIHEDLGEQFDIIIQQAIAQSQLSKEVRKKMEHTVILECV